VTRHIYGQNIVLTFDIQIRNKAYLPRFTHWYIFRYIFFTKYAKAAGCGIPWQHRPSFETWLNLLYSCSRQ